jgi:hypothetical protein
MFHEHVAADSIDKRAKALRLAQASILAQHREDTRECLLAHVLNRLQGLESRPKL